MQAGQWDAGFQALGELCRLGCAEPVHHTGDFAVEREQAHIFASHDGRGLVDSVGAQGGHGSLANPLGKCWIVVGDGRALNNRNRGHAIGRNTVGFGEPICRAANVGNNLVALRQRIGAQRKAHGYFVRDDVVLCPAMDGSHGQHSGHLRAHLATDDGLSHKDELRSKHDGVLPRFGPGAVSADAADGDDERCGAGQQRAAFHRYRSSGVIVRVML